MAFCTECGKELNAEGVCENCQNKNKNSDTPFDKAVEAVKNAPDETAEYDETDIKDNIFFAIIAYFGILILIPVIARPDSKFARFHANQALDLMILTLLYGIIATTITAISFTSGTAFGLFILGIFLILSVGIFLLWILGIGNAAQGKAKQVPFIGKINLLK
ncbi:MAG: hypothetical protein PUD72_05650 [Oscillospiraceae bacterium]|nr:hypothetical protein [Oscillospiraceae bacterium]